MKPPYRCVDFCFTFVVDLLKSKYLNEYNNRCTSVFQGEKDERNGGGIWQEEEDTAREGPWPVGS